MQVVQDGLVARKRPLGHACLPQRAHNHQRRQLPLGRLKRNQAGIKLLAPGNERLAARVDRVGVEQRQAGREEVGKLLKGNGSVGLGAEEGGEGVEGNAVLERVAVNV